MRYMPDERNGGLDAERISRASKLGHTSEFPHRPLITESNNAGRFDIPASFMYLFLAETTFLYMWPYT
jgi:hypothetical protein